MVEQVMHQTKLRLRGFGCIIFCCILTSSVPSFGTEIKKSETGAPVVTSWDQIKNIDRGSASLVGSIQIIRDILFFSESSNSGSEISCISNTQRDFNYVLKRKNFRKILDSKYIEKLRSLTKSGKGELVEINFLFQKNEKYNENPSSLICIDKNCIKNSTRFNITEIKYLNKKNIKCVVMGF